MADAVDRRKEEARAVEGSFEVWTAASFAGVASTVTSSDAVPHR